MYNLDSISTRLQLRMSLFYVLLNCTVLLLCLSFRSRHWLFVVVWIQSVNEVVLWKLPAGENPYKVDGEKIKTRAKLLQKYLKDEQKELQALYALQALMVQMEQPASEFLFFDHAILYTTTQEKNAHAFISLYSFPKKCCFVKRNCCSSWMWHISKTSENFNKKKSFILFQLYCCIGCTSKPSLLEPKLLYDHCHNRLCCGENLKRTFYVI